MLEVVETVFKGGAFVPEKTFDLPEGARVKIVVETIEPQTRIAESAEESQNSHVQEPTITDPEERRKVFAQLFKSWDENPIPANAPRKFTREELYERR